jgi:hypothetical protein
MSQQRHEGSEDQDGEHTSTTPNVSPDRKAANVAPPTRNPRAKPATCLFTASLRVAEPSFEVSQVDRPVHRRSHSLTSSATQTRRRHREIANVANTDDRGHPDHRLDHRLGDGTDAQQQPSHSVDHRCDWEERMQEIVPSKALLRRSPSVAETARLVAFLASEQASAMTGAIVNSSCGQVLD